MVVRFGIEGVGGSPEVFSTQPISNNTEKGKIAIYLVTSTGDVYTTGELTVLQGGTALGYRHTTSIVVHHVERGAVLCA